MPKKPLGIRTPDWNNADYTVIGGKALEPDQFSPELVDMLNHQGLLDTYLTIKGDTYPELVKEFYQHLVAIKRGDKLEITTKVRGKEIILSEGRLAKLLKLTTTGVSNYDRKGWIDTQNTGYKDYLGYLLGKEEGFTSATRPNRKWLTAEQKILVMIVTDSLLPTNNKSKDVGSLECTFAYLLKHKIKFNLPALMLKHMEFCKTSNRLSLPYGMILSWIMEKKGVDLSHTEIKTANGMVFNAQNLRRNDIYYTEGGQYITLEEICLKPEGERRELVDQLDISNKKFKRAMQECGEPGENEEQEEDSEPNPPAPAQTRGNPRGQNEESVNERILAQLTRQNQIIDEGFSSLIRATRALDQRVATIEAMLGTRGASSSGAENQGIPEPSKTTSHQKSSLPQRGQHVKPHLLTRRPKYVTSGGERVDPRTGFEDEASCKGGSV